MRLGLGKKSAGRGRDRAAKNPHSVHLWGSRLGLPSRRVKWSKSTELFLRKTSSATPSTQALRGIRLSWHWHRHSWEKQGVEPSYSTIRIPQTFPFRAVARPFLEVLL